MVSPISTPSLEISTAKGSNTLSGKRKDPPDGQPFEHNAKKQKTNHSSHKKVLFLREDLGGKRGGKEKGGKVFLATVKNQRDEKSRIAKKVEHSPCIEKALLKSFNKKNTPHTPILTEIFKGEKHLCLVQKDGGYNLHQINQKWHLRSKEEENFSEKTIDFVERVAKQLLEVIAEVHREEWKYPGKSSKNFLLHGNINPKNILINKYGQLQLVDWEQCEFLNKNKPTSQTTAIACPYRAPEVLADGKVSKMADIWAVGCVLFEILTGEPFIPPIVFQETGEAVVERTKEEIFAMICFIAKRLRLPNDKENSFINRAFQTYAEEIGNERVAYVRFVQEVKKKAWEVDPYDKAIKTKYKGVKGERLKRLRELLHQMLHFSPRKRKGADGCLNHPFFSSPDSKDLQFSISFAEEFMGKNYSIEILNSQNERVLDLFPFRKQVCCHLTKGPKEEYRIFLKKPESDVKKVASCFLQNGVIYKIPFTELEDKKVEGDSEKTPEEKVESPRG